MDKAVDRLLAELEGVADRRARFRTVLVLRRHGETSAILEVLTESDGTPLRVFDVDFKAEKRFQ